MRFGKRFFYDINKLTMKSVTNFLICFVLTFTMISCQDVEEKQPNIILIMADDLGYGDLGCDGQEIIQTPISTGWPLQVSGLQNIMLAIPSVLLQGVP